MGPEAKGGGAMHANVTLVQSGCFYTERRRDLKVHKLEAISEFRDTFHTGKRDKAGQVRGVAADGM